MIHKKIFLFLLPSLLLFSCNDDSKIKDLEKKLFSANKRIVELENEKRELEGRILISASKGQRILCENCGKVLNEDIKTFQVPIKEINKYIVEVIQKICKDCAKYIPTSREIEICNDFMSEDIKRIRSYPPEKFTIELDNKTAEVMDKKFMNKWNLSKEELNRIIPTVRLWASENHYLRESIVTGEGIEKAKVLRSKIYSE